MKKKTDEPKKVLIRESVWATLFIMLQILYVVGIAFVMMAYSKVEDLSNNDLYLGLFATSFMLFAAFKMIPDVLSDSIGAIKEAYKKIK